MKYVVATILLAFISFVNLILAVSMNLVRQTLFDALLDAASQQGIYGKVESLYTNLEIVFWLLFLFSAIGAIAWYILGSHQEEHESYTGYQERGPY